MKYQNQEVTRSIIYIYSPLFHIRIYYLCPPFFNHPNDPDFLVPIFTRYGQLLSIPSLNLLNAVTSITFITNKYLLCVNYYHDTVLGL